MPAVGFAPAALCFSRSRTGKQFLRQERRSRRPRCVQDRLEYCPTSSSLLNGALRPLQCRPNGVCDGRQSLSSLSLIGIRGERVARDASIEPVDKLDRRFPGKPYRHSGPSRATFAFGFECGPEWLVGQPRFHEFEELQDDEEIVIGDRELDGSHRGTHPAGRCRHPLRRRPTRSATSGLPGRLAEWSWPRGAASTRTSPQSEQQLGQ
jgi:hypothetical protein